VEEYAKQETALAAYFLLVSRSTYFSTLNVEAIRYSETSVDLHPTTRRYLPEYSSTLHSDRYENLKSNEE
jgi:hypothetical protein